MKINYVLILAAGLSSGLMALPVYSDDQPLPTPAAGDTNKLEAPAAPLIPVAPAKKSTGTEKKPAASTTAKKAADTKAKDSKAKAEETVAAAPLTPGPATARQDNVNIRGQAAINSEIVTKLKKGEQVTVLEEITNKKPKADEPAKWAKIKLPAGAVVWVHSMYIDADKKVKPKKLNLRSGPGENYSVVGTVEKGAAVKEIEKKGDWIKVEAPAEAFGFVAAHLLINKEPEKPMIAAVEPKAPVIPVIPVAPPPAPTEVAVGDPTPIPVASDPVTPNPFPTIPVTPTPTVDPTTPTPIPVTETKPDDEDKEEQLIKRVITREGIMKKSVSIQAPAFFVLESLENGKTINYLHATSTNMVLKDFWNQRVVVTGEEQLDERWPNVPVIYIESLKAVQE
jgi:SH3-like domain-containing protein